MPRRLFALTCLFVAASSQRVPNSVFVIPDAPEVATAKPYELPECVPPGIDGFGNKWWGSFSLCEGDVRVVVDGYSAALSGAGVHYEVDTRKCPTGASFESVEDDAFFEKSIAAQTEDLRSRITRLLLQLSDACSAPIEAGALLDQDFDREFRDLAGSYWLHVPKDQIRAGRVRGRGGS